MAHVRTNRFRRWAAMWSSPTLCVYDWSVWSGSLLRNIAPRARPICATAEEKPHEVAARLPDSARTMLLHLDISNNAPFIADAEEFARVMGERGVRVLNGQVRDIRKRTVQSCCEKYGLGSLQAAETGDAEELLIVKTDLNAGGVREQKLSPEQRKRFNLPAEYSRLGGVHGYYVKRRGDLEAEAWNDPDLFVERFVQNAPGRFFRVYVAMDAVVISEAYMEGPLKRMGGDIRRYNHWAWRRGEDLEVENGTKAKLPEKLLRVARVFIGNFGLEYGAMDVVESAEGEFFIVDVNKTPFWGKEHQPGLLRHLRKGFLKGAKR